MMQDVTHLADHLSSLRQEIAHLQDMNTHYMPTKPSTPRLMNQH